MSRIVMARSSERVSVASGDSITVFTQAAAVVSQDVGGTLTPLGTVTSAQQTFGPFGSTALIVIDSGAGAAIYDVGSSPLLQGLMGNHVQRTPIAINAAGAIPISAMANGLITSNSLLGITGTLPTGSALDAALGLRIDDSFDWHVLAVGLFGFTIGTSAGHTLVGNATVGSGGAGTFRTRKTAAATFVTYSIG